MARALVTSVQSYATFKGWALPVLQTYAARSLRTKSNALYQLCYTRTLHPDLPPKEPLRNQDMLWAMLGLSSGASNHKVRAQRTGTMNVAGCAMEYRRSLAGPGIILSSEAVGATHDYLHVYALNNRVEGSNWRVAANVKPVDIPEVTRRMAQVLDFFANCGHFKVTAPGSASKPDSMIMYLAHDGAYAQTEQAVRDALDGLAIQETFAPMWNELAPGVAVGAEPPKVQNAGGSSFGSYRCLLTAMAFDWAVQNHVPGHPENLTAQDFGAAMDAFFNRYGVPTNAPHDQYQLVIGVAPQPPAARTSYITQGEWDAYLAAFAISNGVAANTYAGRAIENCPVIV